MQYKPLSFQCFPKLTGESLALPKDPHRTFQELPGAQRKSQIIPRGSQGRTRYAQVHQRMPQRSPRTPKLRNLAPFAPSLQPPSLGCLGGIAKRLMTMCIRKKTPAAAMEKQIGKSVFGFMFADSQPEKDANDVCEKKQHV